MDFYNDFGEAEHAWVEVENGDGQLLSDDENDFNWTLDGDPDADGFTNWNWAAYLAPQWSASTGIGSNSDFGRFEVKYGTLTTNPWAVIEIHYEECEEPAGPFGC